MEQEHSFSFQAAMANAVRFSFFSRRGCGLPYGVWSRRCNPIELTRREWEDVAGKAGTRHVNIEVRCSDSREHRRRVDTREQDIAGLKLPTWEEVEQRIYDAWTGDRIVVDTAAGSVEDCVRAILAGLSHL